MSRRASLYVHNPNPEKMTGWGGVGLADGGNAGAERRLWAGGVGGWLWAAVRLIDATADEEEEEEVDGRWGLTGSGRRKKEKEEENG